jgi:hypothetical protein
MEEYEVVDFDYRKLFTEYEKKRNKMKWSIDDLTKTKIHAIKSLEKLGKVTDQLILNAEQTNNPRIDLDDGHKYFYISETISRGQAAITAAGGISTGVGTALGTWALVSTFGVASTGTAIGGISGIAATNATFALIGGGTLAAGGGGIAAGMATMTGLFAIPAIVFTGVFSHLSANKKIRKMNDAMAEMKKAIPAIEKDLRNVDDYLNKYHSSILKTTTSVSQLTSKFNVEFQYNYKKIYRIPVLSRLIKWFREKVLRKSYYSDGDFEFIYAILETAEKLADSINKEIVAG